MISNFDFWPDFNTRESICDGKTDIPLATFPEKNVRFLRIFAYHFKTTKIKTSGVKKHVCNKLRYYRKKHLSKYSASHPLR